jgi:hypothetical protein
VVYAACMRLHTAVRKALFVLLAGFVIVLPLQSVLPDQLRAETGTWVDGDLPKLEAREQIKGLPSDSCFSTMFTYLSFTKHDGSFSSTAREKQISVCATRASPGLTGSSVFSNFSSDFVAPGFAYRILDYLGRPTGIVPVPGRGTFFYSDSTDSRNNGTRVLRFYDGFSRAGRFEPYYGNINEMVFKFTAPLAEPLKDSAGNAIRLKDSNYAFSADGEWMVLEASGLGILRINTQTRAMQLIATGYNPHSPGKTFAISNDGNFVVQSGYGTGSYVYDLSGCQSGPFVNGASTNTVTGCRSRYVQQSLTAQLTGFFGLVSMRFSADGKSVRGVAMRKNAAGATEYFNVTYSVAGYQPPQLGYLALGDSFSSGEGAYEYEVGTDQPENNCHLSKRSYPYLTAQALNISSFHSVACSGAVSSDYYGPQDKKNEVNSPLGFWLPGYRGQYEYIERAGDASAVTISMIGNDIGFGDKLKKCIIGTDSCFHFREDRESVAYEIHSKFNTLLSIYADIQDKAPEAKIYVLGYPQLFGTGSECGLNVRLDTEERLFARGLATYLNAVIKAATEKVGVQYIDVEHAFSGKQHCDSGEKAVNGLTAGDDFVADIGPIGNESYHPNQVGHELFRDALLGQSENFTRERPEPDETKQAPFVGTSVYDALIGNAPGGGIFSRATYTALEGLEVAVKAAPVIINPTEVVFNPLRQVQVWFNSEPTYAGSLTTNEQGELNGEITVPASLPPGYHTLHIYGQNIAGEDVDLYKTIYVAESLTDYDGDGILNIEEKCLVVEPANVDEDRDGIDDACDGEISEPPVDTVAPLVTGTPDRQPNEAGWYNADVTITWNGTDLEPSSGYPTQPVQTIAAKEGTNTYTSDESCDPAGNCATGSFDLSIDKAAPEINFSLSPAPNAGGWNNGAVIVTFNCNDALSGIATCSEPVAVSGEDSGRIVTGSATDNAGNVTDINAVVMIDSTKPTVTQTVLPADNGEGWHNTDVTITPVCDDNLSGIASCSSAVVLAADSENQTVTSTATDKAGNTAEIITQVSLDKTVPSLGTASWTGNPKAATDTATLTIPATDNLSGITEAEYFLGESDPGQGNGANMTLDGDNLTTTFGADFPTGVFKVTVRAKDKAGNWSALVSDYLVVYNPDGMRMTGKKTIRPSLANGDVLPGLGDFTSDDKAKFGFNVRYDKDGQIHKTSDFQFGYKIGEKCKNAEKAHGCHIFNLNATSIEWLTTQGVNNSTGIFQGTAELEIDGAISEVAFRLSGIDGELLNATDPDHLTLRIFRSDDNPNTATPIYRVNTDVERGNIRIRPQ